MARESVLVVDDEEDIVQLVSYSLAREGYQVLAAGLREHIETVSRQNREHEAVLASMAEGVIAVDRDLRIIDDLLALYRIEREAAAEAIDLRPTDPAEVICAAIADCEPRAGDRRIRIESSCPPSLEARMNPRLIEQALVNLLDNAVKYSPDGATVTVEADRADSRVRICVRDHGCGIPGEHLERIFEPFYCVDKSRSRALGGTGLGLAIVQHIARVHGGQVTVQSRVGEGSTFCLVLPA